MGKPISLFTDYSQSENRVTNYCGLMMKLIYEESPRRFSELIDKLTAGQGDILVGPMFRQQQRERASVPDLTISQQAFTIAFETKLTNWFYSEQINNHLLGLKEGSGSLILFLLSNFETDHSVEFKNQISDAGASGVLLIPISYEELLSGFESVCTSDYLAGLLDEFREYLDVKQLLPRWKYLLDVVNCATTMHEIEAGVYLCPDTKGAYSHKRARFLGPYANKAVRTIYEIDAVVSIGSRFEDNKIKWNNQPDMSSQQLIDRAIANVQELRPEQIQHTALQVFLLGDRAVTFFEKDTPGGMQSSKQYFWNVGNGKANAEELAAYLTNKKWSKL